ncbi:hypothetical protein GEV33_003113 [Tenebrio molitor]|uniref:Uncharacterized protein n=1 Tax=Tenebrio molitor TaxID=7067 RepID=A0A8J6HU66_TENMO|nr:hypothetical protein GEV33_003113 [Tenebrio molitor]
MQSVGGRKSRDEDAAALAAYHRKQRPEGLYCWPDSITPDIVSVFLQRSLHDRSVMMWRRFAPVITKASIAWGWLLQVAGGSPKKRKGRTGVSDSIVDGNAKTDVSNRKEPGIFCGESEQPQTFMSETSFVKVVFHSDNFTDQTYFSFDTRAEQQLVVYLRYGQHPELYPNRRGEVVQG